MALVRWAVDLATTLEREMTTDREPQADALLRRELPNLRAAWRLVRDRGMLDDAVTLVVALFDAITYRDMVELRSWAIELAGDPLLAAHPRAAAVLGTAAEASYQSGDHERADRYATAGLDLAADSRGSWLCLMARSVVALARGSYAEVVELCEAAAPLAPGPRENLGVAALAMAYSGKLDEARAFNERGLTGAVSPTMLAWGAYVTAEIDSLAGQNEHAERHYVRSIDLARASGATFLVGVATVGLFSVRADAGRTEDALQGCRDAIDYFARTGNWIHQWTTLRNLADLLRGLGDHNVAALLHAAADAAPDAPAANRPLDDPTSAPARTAAPLGRAEVLQTAREAIERNLTRTQLSTRRHDDGAPAG